MSYSPHDLVYRTHQRRKSGSTSSVSDLDYQSILESVRNQISANHSEELAQFMGTPDFRPRLRRYIVRYVNRMNLTSTADISTLTERIYNDMAGLGLIDSYLARADVEEININGARPGEMWIYTPEGKEQVLTGFASTEEAMNMVVKAARLGDVVLDGAKPFGDSYLSRGVRMSGAINPVVDRDAGGIASIRKQKPTHVTRDNVLKWGTTIDEELDLLVMCIKAGVSVGIAGSTGAGKTADMSLLLTQVPDKARVITIEDTRELFLVKLDENGCAINDRVHLLTKEPPNPVTMQDLLKLSLRLHPKILVPAEMRGEEAWTVVEAGRTGHTILSSLHANSAKEAYDRILTMCLMSRIHLSEERILKHIVSAFPLMVFKRQLSDGSRKFWEIFEATGVENGEVVGSAIYKFVVTGKETDNEGKISKILGHHALIGKLSDALCQRMFDEGVELDFLLRYNSRFSPISV